MNNIDHDTLLDYVMGGLSPEEEQAVAQYLQTHPEEAAMVRDWFETMADLALAQEPVTLSEQAEANLLARIRGDAGSQQATTSPVQIPETVIPETPSRRPMRTWWLAALATAALAATVYLAVRPQPVDPVRQMASLCADSTVQCQTIDSDTGSIATLAKREDNSVFVLFVDEPPEGQVYQAWEVIGEAHISLGTWSGRVVDIEQPLPANSILGVTIEPTGGSPDPTTTPIVAVPMSDDGS